jgi:hypothetical protein
VNVSPPGYNCTPNKVQLEGFEGADPLVEKVGSHIRVRNRFLRLWLCTQKILIQELIPQLREEGQYRASITRVCPQLPLDSGLDG